MEATTAGGFWVFAGCVYSVVGCILALKVINHVEFEKSLLRIHIILGVCFLPITILLLIGHFVMMIAGHIYDALGLGKKIIDL